MKTFFWCYCYNFNLDVDLTKFKNTYSQKKTPPFYQLHFSSISDCSISSSIPIHSNLYNRIRKNIFVGIRTLDPVQRFWRIILHFYFADFSVVVSKNSFSLPLFSCCKCSLIKFTAPYLSFLYSTRLIFFARRLYGLDVIYKSVFSLLELFASGRLK